MSKIAVIEPKAEYDRQNEAVFREQVRSISDNAYDARSNLTVPFGKSLAFTSAQGQKIAFGYNTSGEFTIQQDASTPFGMASISYVSTVESGLTGSLATLTTTVAANLATSLAAVSTEATARATADSAEASTRSSADATLTANLATTNANVATNTTAIATETTARAAQDTTLRATIQSGFEALGPSDFSADGLYWTSTFGGTPAAVADPSGVTYVDVTNLGRALRTSSFPTYITPKAVIRPTVGRRYRVTVEVRAQSDASGGSLSASLLNVNGLDVSWAHGDSGGAFSAVSGFNTNEVMTVAGGWRTLSVYLTLATATTYDAAWRPRLDMTRSAGSGGVMEVRKFLIEDVTDSYTTNANVTTNTSAIATVNGAAAFWETIVSAGGGDLAAVRLKAGTSGSYIELISTVLRLANVTNGSVIEVMRATSGEAYFSRPISSDSASRRLTIGPGYGVSGEEVVLWFGPVATAPTSQSRTNGYFALGTDAKIYFGSSDLAVLTTPMGATMTGNYSTTHGATVTPTLDVSPQVSSITNGTATYTYRWAIVDMADGIAPVITNGDTAQCTLTRSATLAAAADYIGTASCTITDSNGKQVVKYYEFADTSTI